MDGGEGNDSVVHGGLVGASLEDKPLPEIILEVGLELREGIGTHISNGAMLIL